MAQNLFPVNCSNFTLSQLQSFNLSRSVSAMVCTLLTVAILVSLIIYKSYKTTLQRLFLYLAIVVLLQLLFISMDIELQFDFNGRDEFCKCLGFFTQWTAIVTYLYALLITVYLLYLMYKNLKTNSSGPGVLRQSKKLQKTIEIVVVLTVALLPPTFLWVPFYHGTFGQTSGACWITNMNKDCKLFDSADAIFFGFGIFQAVSFILLIAFFGTVIVFCGFALKYRLTRRHHLKTICQTLLLMSFLAMSAMAELAGLLQYIYNTISGNVIPYGIQVAYVTVIPVSQMIIPLGFVIYFYSFNKKSQQSIFHGVKIQRMCSCCCLRRKGTNAYVTIAQSQVATAPRSTRIEPPSETYFNVSYTGGFTNITSKITQEDTGYGSIAT